MSIAVLGTDLGKNVCSLVGFDKTGAVILRRRAKRETLIGMAEKLPRCIVAMEACCGAHHLGRIFAARGHDVRLMSPEYVCPYVKAQKNDDRDAEGIAEAATRPTMRFVELKTQDQLDMQTLHRSRERLVTEHTALINQLRAILLERGLVVGQGKRKLQEFLAELMDEREGKGLSSRMALLVAYARAQWTELDRRIAAFDAEFAAAVRAPPPRIRVRPRSTGAGSPAAGTRLIAETRLLAVSRQLGAQRLQRCRGIEICPCSRTSPRWLPSATRDRDRVFVHIKADIDDMLIYDPSPMHEARRRFTRRNPRNPAYCETGRPISGEHLV